MPQLNLNLRDSLFYSAEMSRRVPAEAARPTGRSASCQGYRSCWSVPSMRCHRLAARRRQPGRDPQPARRPLPPPAQLGRLPHGQGSRRGRGVRCGSRQLRPPGCLSERQRRRLQRPLRRGKVPLELELERLGIEVKHATPNHPQTSGKVERLHQTLKRFLGRQPPATSLALLQAQLDLVRSRYKQLRHNRALGRRTPLVASTHASRQSHRCPPSRPTIASAKIRSTTTAASLSATWDGSGTVGSASAIATARSISWSPATTSASSPPTASLSAISSSTQTDSTSASVDAGQSTMS
jgi:hypothetical protein